jgi:DNA-binding CsgD family transcriptional regulator
MATGPDTLTDTLTDKEKDALRLLLRGHDAKSSARALGLSVHTVNERLRDARRKLGVTSSREAARRLLEAEGEAPEMLGDKALGEAPEAPARHTAEAAAGRWAGPRRALTLAGVLAMSLLIAALFLPTSPLSLTATAPAASIAASAEAADPAAAATAAEAFLTLIDQSRWADSYAATGAQFRALNTLERWSAVSEKVRPPLGALLTRNLVANEFVPAPPEGYQLVKFASTYASGASQTESVSLAWEDGAWRVVGIVID